MFCNVNFSYSFIIPETIIFYVVLNNLQWSAVIDDNVLF